MNIIVVGCQSGDEGKGKFTDVFSESAYAVVRYQGGPHTGHTVVVAEQEYRFVQIPSGLLHGAIGVLGNGCVIAPAKLVKEIADLEEQGVRPRLVISETAHVVMPYHLAQDEVMERWRGDGIATDVKTGLKTGTGQIGSTKSGVGPCREDKIARIGIRMIDLIDKDVLKARLSHLIPYKRDLIEKLHGVSLASLGIDLDLNRLVEEYHAYGLALAPYLGDISSFLASARAAGRYLLYEGAQSMGLDIEYGTYPYVSSGHSAACGVAVGTGTPPYVDFNVIGVAKAYMVQSGGGPLPTEIHGSVADYLVQRGRELGTVTGRRRRVGWLDLCFLRKAIRIDGIKYLCITNIDVLAGIEEIKIATHYLVNEERRDEYPVSIAEAACVEPVYQTFAAWQEQDWGQIAQKGFEALPENARIYINFILNSLDIELAAVSVGRDRDKTIVLRSPLSELVLA
ncbi:adenylosuccinate synthase [Westiellopsis prolifica IICB1]|nr:adenylosuccinate synthase [Westiellopsis prolifica IICB1]